MDSNICRNAHTGKKNRDSYQNPGFPIVPVPYPVSPQVLVRVV